MGEVCHAKYHCLVICFHSYFDFKMSPRGDSKTVHFPIIAWIKKRRFLIATVERIEGFGL